MLQPHLLTLAQTHADGSEEWICPICGHAVLIAWENTARNTILIHGDTRFSHVGGCSTQHISARTYQAADESSNNRVPIIAIHEEIGAVPITDMLQPWLRWMYSAGLADATDNMP